MQVVLHKISSSIFFILLLIFILVRVYAELNVTTYISLTKQLYCICKREEFHRSVISKTGNLMCTTHYYYYYPLHCYFTCVYGFITSLLLFYSITNLTFYLLFCLWMYLLCLLSLLLLLLLLIALIFLLHVLSGIIIFYYYFLFLLLLLYFCAVLCL
jgi:hypothetical protein